MKVLSFCRNECGMVLVTGLAFMAILGIMGATAMMITSTEIRISHNYKTGKQALYIAEAGIERAIKDLEGNANSFDDILMGVDGVAASSDDGVLVSIGSPPVPFGDGDYKVWVIDNDDGDGDLFTDLDEKVVIASTGSIHGAVRTVEVVFSKLSIPIDVDGALSIYGDSPKADLSGNTTVDGNDYLPADFDCHGGECKGSLISGGVGTAGIYPPADTLFVERSGNSTLDGSPAQLPESEEAGHYASDYWQWLANELTSIADVTFDGGNISGQQTLGTRANPQITLINGDVHFTGTVAGAGILIMKAKAKFTGTFHYEGLVVVLNNDGADEEAEFELGAQGTARFFGAVVVAGPDPSEVEMGGNARILYSSDALANIQNSFNTSKVLSWRLR